ncbi:MAG: flagellar basal body L-ring protein FlgH [Trichloromonadaceae bacterium]
MKNFGLVLCLFSLLLSGCVQRVPQFAGPPPVPPAVAPPEIPATAGSLWTTRQGSLFGDNKASNVGDIVTVAIFEAASASKQASTATDRESNMSADLSTLFGLEKNISNINSTIDPSALVNTGFKNEFKGSGSTSRKENLVATLTSRVVTVYANGNLGIEGGKSVKVNNEEQLIHLSGIVRPVDISSQNIVDSKYVLDARITYTGKGVISDKQSQGWLVRALDTVWPF